MTLARRPFLFYRELNYHDLKIHDIWKHWTAVSTLLGLISSVYRDLHDWRSNQRPQIAEPKLYNWATSSYRGISQFSLTKKIEIIIIQ